MKPEDCIFCKIVKGELPCAKIYENDNVMAFLDIGPVNKGHALVIPKRHYENIFELPEEVLKEMTIVMKKVCKAVEKGVHAEGISIGMSNGTAAGQVVPHAHIHIMPRYSDDGLKLWPQGQYREGELEVIRKKIVEHI